VVVVVVVVVDLTSSTACMGILGVSLICFRWPLYNTVTADDMMLPLTISLSPDGSSGTSSRQS